MGGYKRRTTVTRVAREGSIFRSNIERIRAVEDTIRATKKYTEGLGTMHLRHPVQGTGFPSKVFCKYYEVYPETEVSWDMPAGIALDWLWHDVPCVDVLFKYDYRVNEASVQVKDGPEAVKQLAAAIPGFSTALAEAVAGSNGKSRNA